MVTLLARTTLSSNPSFTFSFFAFDPNPVVFLTLRVHNVDVISQIALSTVRGAVEFFLGYDNFFFGLHRTLVEGRWGNKIFGRFRRVEDGVVFIVGVEVVEEGGVDVERIGFEGWDWACGKGVENGPFVSSEKKRLAGLERKERGVVV